MCTASSTVRPRATASASPSVPASCSPASCSPPSNFRPGLREVPGMTCKTAAWPHDSDWHDHDHGRITPTVGDDVMAGFLRVDGKNIQVGSADELMVPPAGNLICVYQDGAFAII